LRLYPDAASGKNSNRLEVTILVAVNPKSTLRIIPTFSWVLDLMGHGI
jgi:hypothetical protein